jgi:hypothetical protein
VRKKRTFIAAITAFAATIAAATFVITAPDASAYTDGIFRVTCGFSHSAPDDPIVHPNKPGASHLHDFFGNAGTRASSTYDSLIGVRSTCPNKDTSAYWVPAVYQNGKKLTPWYLTAYYISPVNDHSKIQAWPKDFRMIVGDAKNTDVSKVDGFIRWGCTDNTAFGKTPPASCPKAGAIQVRIEFPACWDGVIAPNGAENKAGHMRYPSGNKCPKGYDHVLPTMRMNIGYQTGVNTGNITLSSGSVASIHADFLNSWDQPTLENLVRDCLRAAKTCDRFQGTTPGRNP